MEFRWNEWNIEHIAQHGVWPEEAEWVVSRDRAEPVGRGKFRARGQTTSGRYLQVIFVPEPDDSAFVIHARDLTEKEKRALRRRRR